MTKHIAIPALYKPELINQVIKPDVQNDVMDLLSKKFAMDPAYISSSNENFGAIAFGRAVSLKALTNTDALIETKNLKADDPVSLHEGAVEIKFLYVEQTVEDKDGLKTEKAILELLTPMVFTMNRSRDGLVLNYAYKHMLVVPGLKGVENSKAVQVEQIIDFEGSVSGDKIIITMNKKPYGLNVLGYFAKVHRTVK